MRRGHNVVPVLTGVIYGAIVVAWATYLVPLALRRDEQESRTRSIERFSTAMRVLVSRGAPVEAAAGADAQAESSSEPDRVLVTPQTNRATERAAAARRRVVLYVLMGLTLLVALASVLGLLPWWSFVVPLALIGGFLVVARQSVRKANAPYWVEVPTVAREAAPSTVERVERDEDEATVTLSAADREVVAPTRVAHGSTLWDPLPVTLPTYVDAPVARRAFRTIPLGADASAPQPSQQLEPASPAAAQDEISEDVPQAVNG